MKTKLLHCATVAALSVMCASANAALGDLSLVNFVTYGDGQSYSLPVSQVICENAPLPVPDCTAYRVASTPGAIKDLVVIATGAGGQDVVNNPTGMENAFSTPNAGGDPSFATSAATAQGITGSVQTQIDTTWDASVAALQTFLSGEDPIFFFNNNQTNSGGSTNQELAAWARLWITDDQGTAVDMDGNAANGINPLTFANRTPPTFPGGVPTCAAGAYGSASPYAVVPGGGGCPSPFVNGPNQYSNFYDNSGFAEPVVGSNAATDFVLSGGRVCLNAAFTPVACDGSQGPVAYNNIDHNLGADTVAYAIVFPELNNTLAALFGDPNLDLTKYTFHMDFRMGCDLPPINTKGKDIPNPTCTGRSLNNGYEQLFLGTATKVINVPEPGTLALLGGMLAILPLVRKTLRGRVKAA